MRKYWAFFKANFQATITYRGPIFIWLVSNLVNLLVILTVWLSVSASKTIGGYTKPELISYYILALFLQWVGGWFPFYGVAEQIKKGEIVFSLVRPFSYYWQKFFEELGWHAVSVWVGLAASLGVAIFFHQYFVFVLNLEKIILLLAAVILSIFVVFGLSLCLGLTAFWLTEVWALDSVFWMTRSIFGGQGIPISFIPGLYLTLVKILPFRYTFSFPLEIYFGKLTSLEVAFGFLMQIIWSAVLYCVYKFMWAKGRAAYTSFGQ